MLSVLFVDSLSLSPSLFSLYGFDGTRDHSGEAHRSRNRKQPLANSCEDTEALHTVGHKPLNSRLTYDPDPEPVLKTLKQEIQLSHIRL